jgi:hypothetical protein
MRAIAILALAALSEVPGAAAVNLVVHKIAKELTGAEVTTLATGGYNSAAGNLIAVWTATYSGAQPIGSVTDSAGDAFTPAARHKGTWYGQWFYARGVKGESYNVVTIHPAPTGRATMIYPAMLVMEFSGADPNAPLAADIAGEQGSLTGAWNSAPFDVPAGSVALLGIVTANGGNYTAGSGFKIEDSYITPASAKFSVAALDRYFDAAQTGVVAGVTWSGTLQATGAVVVFKPSGK